MRLPTRLLRRNIKAHKGDFGHILILAGSARMSGAGLLCADAALRCGAGLVTLGIPESLNLGIIGGKSYEVMTLPLPGTPSGTLDSRGFSEIKDFCDSVDVCVVGPGLSQNKETAKLIRRIVFEIMKPMVVDADGITALAGHLKELRRCAATKKGVQRVFTPHPGEMANLTGKSVEDVQSSRSLTARQFAQAFCATIVLKGYRTVVADHAGMLYINSTGNPGMATAGSGDVLSGVIAACLGQGMDSFEACKFGVFIHGLAGDLAAKEKTQIAMIASDIIAEIPAAIKTSLV